MGSVCPRSPSSLVVQPALSFVWEATEAKRGCVSPWPPHPWVGEGQSPRLAGGVLVLTRGDPSVPTAILFLLTPGKQQSQDTLSAGQHEKEADSWGLLAAVCSPRNEYLQSPGETEKGTRLQCNYIS